MDKYKRVYLYSDAWVSVSAQRDILEEYDENPYMIIVHKSNIHEPREIIYRISEEFMEAIEKEYGESGLPFKPPSEWRKEQCLTD